jgi:hypothetical protein
MHDDKASMIPRPYWNCRFPKKGHSLRQKMDDKVQALGLGPSVVVVAAADY